MIYAAGSGWRMDRQPEDPGRIVLETSALGGAVLDPVQARYLAQRLDRWALEAVEGTDHAP